MKVGQVHLFSVEIPFQMLDAGQVLYHANYLALCDLARQAAIRDAGASFESFWKEGITFVVIEFKARFLEAVKMGDSVLIATESRRASGATLEVRQSWYVRSEGLPGWKKGFVEKLPEEGKLCFDAELVLASTKLNPPRATRLPHRLREALGV